MPCSFMLESLYWHYTNQAPPPSYSSCVDAEIHQEHRRHSRGEHNVQPLSQESSGANQRDVCLRSECSAAKRQRCRHFLSALARELLPPNTFHLVVSKEWFWIKMEELNNLKAGNSVTRLCHVPAGFHSPFL